MKPQLNFCGLIFQMSLVSMLILFTRSCVQQDDPPPVPMLFTGEVVEITKDGCIFSGLFENVEADRVTDFGFIWGSQTIPSLQSSYKYSLPLPFKEGAYSCHIQTSLKINYTYNMRIFVTYDDNRNYYGKAVEFFSLGSKEPEINEIDPPSACFGDTIKIIGKYFGLETHNKQVYFGEDLAPVVIANDTIIETVVPYFSDRNSYFSTNKVHINIIREGYPTGETDLFQLSPPRIASYDPKTGGSYTRISITGSGFHPEFTKLTLGEYPCDIRLVGDQFVEALLPPLFNDLEDSLRLSVANKQTTIGTVKVMAPVLEYLAPDTAFTNDILTLYGKNLENNNLRFTINGMEDIEIIPSQKYSEDTVFVKVPGGICASELNLGMMLKDEIKAYEDPIAFRQPRVTSIETEENNLFDGSFKISGDYFPDIYPVASVKVNGMESSYTYQYNETSSSIVIEVPANVLPENEWLRADISFCPDTELSFDSVFHIPAPEIYNIPDTIELFSNYTFSGAYFNPISGNQISFGEYTMPAEAPSSNQLFFRPPSDLAAGNYPLHVTTNGQKSNQVNVELVNRWEKLDNLPEEISENRILFLLNNKLYLGGGVWDAEKRFYSYDLQTKHWEQLNPLPINARYGVSGGEYAYVYGNGQIFRYLNDSDTWYFRGQRYYDNVGNTFSREESSGVFYYENKIFIMPVGVTNPHFYFDLETKTWTEFPGWKGSISSYWAMPSVLGEGEAYLFHDNDIYTLDLTDLSLTDTGSQIPYGGKSRIGFSYNGEAYLYSGNGWEIYNIQDNFSCRYIPGPSFYKPAILRDGDKVYLLSNNELWTFDLTLQ